MAEPPLEAEVVQDTRAAALPRAAMTAVGATGTVAGVTEVEPLEAAPVPKAFVALTLKVYGVPLVRPLTVHERAPDVVQVLAPGEEVTV